MPAAPPGAGGADDAEPAVLRRGGARRLRQEAQDDPGARPAAQHPGDERPRATEERGERVAPALAAPCTTVEPCQYILPPCRTHSDRRGV